MRRSSLHRYHAIWLPLPSRHWFPSLIVVASFLPRHLDSLNKAWATLQLPRTPQLQRNKVYGSKREHPLASLLLRPNSLLSPLSAQCAPLVNILMHCSHFWREVVEQHTFLVVYTLTSGGHLTFLSHGGCRYALTITDDHTRWVWVLFLKRKSFQHFTT